MIENRKENGDEMAKIIPFRTRKEWEQEKKERKQWSEWEKSQKENLKLLKERDTKKPPK